jgi:hypothetical protein
MLLPDRLSLQEQLREELQELRKLPRSPEVDDRKV